MGPNRRISQLDGLRALAFLAVFAHHAFKIPLLWMGVDLFFVLSGFLITRNLLDASSSTTRSALGTFFFRRVLRILPPYYLALAFIFVVVPIGVRDLSWYVAFSSNIRDSLYGPIGGSYSSLWSVAVEEQFYLLWPWLVLFAPRRWLGPAFALIAIAAPVCRLVFSAWGYEAVYRLMPCRMDLLAVGALLALAEARSPGWATLRRPAFLVAAVAAVTTFASLSLTTSSFRTSHNSVLFNVFGYGLSTLFFGSVIALSVGLSNGFIYRALCTRVLQYVGRVSYMCYLVHMLALHLAASVASNRVVIAFVALAGTLAFSALSWSFVEQPLQRLRGLVRPVPRSSHT